MNDKSKNFTVAYEDEHLLIVCKPAGMLAQKEGKDSVSLVEYAKEYLHTATDVAEPYIGLIHRLDRPVGGLLILAKNKRCAELMSRLVKNDKLEKNYLAIVFGKPIKEKETLRHYLSVREGRNTTVSEKPHPNFKEAVLDYQILDSKKNNNIAKFDGFLSLLSIRLHSGKKHQIRIQLSAMGNPIVGDSKYFNIEGLRRELITGDLWQRMLKANFLPWGEIALYANHLKFRHPMKANTIIDLTLPYPTGWIKFL